MKRPLNKMTLTIWTMKVFLIGILFQLPINAQQQQQSQPRSDKSYLPGQNPCVGRTNCHDCIQTVGCAWCFVDDFGDRPRCFQPSYPSSNGICPETYTFNPDNIHTVIRAESLTLGRAAAYGGGGGQYVSGVNIEGNSSFSSSISGHSTSSSGSSTYGSGSSSFGASGSSSSSGSSGSSSSFGASGGSGQQIFQITPQEYDLKLRINEPHRIQFKYAQAVDYPVDLYYLMDLSKSMEDDKDTLSTLGDKLSQKMRSMTSDFRLGFGSFVDKVLMPYVSTIPKNLKNPCTGCAAPYGFQHTLSLTENTDSFSQQVSDASVSGNLDAPEGGFDAIMQAIVCKNQIGWRNASRHLIVFSTDAGFHYAGDGKLGGVIAPNDGKCHLDKGVYTHSSLQDYPSISQINQKVIEHSINIIFAVTASQREVYEKLSQHIQGSSAATLSIDSSNVVGLVQEEYSKITQEVEMKDNAASFITIKYYSACLNGEKEVLTRKCDKLKVGDVVSFTAEIIVTECPKDRNDWNQIISIQPVGINEPLKINLALICDCPCERPDHPTYKINSTECHSRGRFACGVCDCGTDYFGRTCECSIHADNEIQMSNKTNGCRQDDMALECSGRGNCVCNICECEKRPNPEEVIGGKYCECDNFSCDRHEKILCSGPEHGECVCGVCACKPAWKGAACDCLASNDTCIPPNGEETCSGHGKCECGQCICDKTDEGRYSGKFCERCPTCAGRCEELKDCVQCQMYKTGKLKDEKACSENCTLFTPQEVETITEISEEKNEYLCQFYDEDDCRFQFVYRETEDGKIDVKAEKDRKCPPKVFMLGIVLAVIAAIVLFGLAILLLWKLFTTIHDRREFARFEKERMMAKWDTGENPIYKQATSTFKNPMYAGK